MPWLEFLWMVAVNIYAFAFPYTKVEESFNMQGIHDILYHGLNLTNYDHKEFPGVVPRTFLGPLLISILTTPFTLVCDSLHLKKRVGQYLVRCILGMLIGYSFIHYKRAVDHIWGRGVGRKLLWISLTQFHFLFYSSRPLPNIFALGIVMLSLSFYLRNRMALFITTAGCAILVFRSELCLFFGPYLLIALLLRRITLTKVVLVAVPAAVGIIGVTTMTDSFFWNRWLWPEGEVFWFNVILNKSGQWGTSPIHWYFTSALPRALLLSVVLVPVGMWVDKRIVLLVGPALSFVAAYSLLPHKELRFIFYVIPVLNTAAAMAFHSMELRGAKSRVYRVLRVLCWCHLLGNLACSGILMVAALFNYPGGEAMTRTHDLVRDSNDVHLHICNYAAQTGVTRFLQENPLWIYNKTEGIEYSSGLLHFSHLLVELNATVEESSSLVALKETHEVKFIVQGFGGLRKQWPFFSLTPKLALLQKRLEF